MGMGERNTMATTSLVRWTRAAIQPCHGQRTAVTIAFHNVDITDLARLNRASSILHTLTAASTDSFSNRVATGNGVATSSSVATGNGSDDSIQSIEISERSDGRR